MSSGGTRTPIAHLASRGNAPAVLGVHVIREARCGSDGGSKGREGKKHFDLSGAGFDGSFDQPLMHREADALGQELHWHSISSPAESSPVFRCLDSVRPNCAVSIVTSRVSIPDLPKSAVSEVAILSDPRPQFLKQNVGAPLLVSIGFDERVIKARCEMQVEVRTDVLRFDQRSRHRPESHDGGIIHPAVMA